MAKGLERRRILVVDPKLQFRYLILPVVVTVTTAGCLFALFSAQAASLKALAPEDLVGEISRVQAQSAMAVGAVLLGHIALILWLGLTLSHKVAGPIYRLRKSMEGLSAGDVSVRITLRRGDRLTDLADAFNQMADALSASREVPPAEAVDESGPPESDA